MIDTKELRRLAQDATPWRWYVGTGTYEGRNIYSANAITDSEGFTYQPVIATAEDNDIQHWDANASFIAAANPAAISELLDRLEAAEKERDALRAELMEQCRLLGMSAEREAKHLAQIAALEKERDVLCAQLDTISTKVHVEYCAYSKDWRESDPAGRIDWLIAMYESVKEDRDALSAELDALKRQEPVGVLHVGSWYGEELQDWEFEANQCACDKLNEVYVSNPTSLPLYALPGAKGD